MEMNKSLYDALNKDLVWGRVGEIYDKNDKKQRIMRALAAKTNTDPNGIDHYYHRKTMYEAAQESPQLGASMLIAGDLKEWRDFFRDVKNYWIDHPNESYLSRIVNGASLARQENKKDLQNNKIGFTMGLTSNLPFEENPEMIKYNSKTVNSLLPRMPKETQ